MVCTSLKKETGKYKNEEKIAQSGNRPPFIHFYSHNAHTRIILPLSFFLLSFSKANCLS
jgi:hypothetical protein